MPVAHKLWQGKKDRLQSAEQSCVSVGANITVDLSDMTVVLSNWLLCWIKHFVIHNSGVSSWCLTKLFILLLFFYLSFTQWAYKHTVYFIGIILYMCCSEAQRKSTASPAPLTSPVMNVTACLVSCCELQFPPKLLELERPVPWFLLCTDNIWVWHQNM